MTVRQRLHRLLTDPFGHREAIAAMQEAEVVLGVLNDMLKDPELLDKMRAWADQQKKARAAEGDG